ncbi:cupredoxin domain-containing protein [Paenibacillus urinalis]|uniref:Cupredoxin domain-containing protein n=1 Tax=Paenibacillus urinalis TaxID=521520 RepID=A0AAX3MWV2_9BACL|nr:MULTISPECIES: cupredoxin domain-containing protein [Paenibacillus]WDH80834.1 cupredoxin domain-containing protein [Paenibacillus urinalis]WDH96887.1 cupredoxin domain-containing protein [Paenibacillus urinalis]WDI00531.1 cupredoxin domain-containing protein [Paenibacillus urinalis]GAK39207.1 hypothetical protein TCA2_1695 [Paenibacillus sp. TCA20]
MNKKLMKSWPFLAIGLAAILVIGGLIIFFQGNSMVPSALDRGQTVQEEEDLSNYEIVTVEINDKGFSPSHIEVKQGVPTKINFKKVTNLTHITSLVSEDFDMLQYLEKGDNYYTVDTTLEPGTYNFNCGMYMTFGTLTVK